MVEVLFRLIQLIGISFEVQKMANATCLRQVIEFHWFDLIQKSGFASREFDRLQIESI